MHLNDNRRTMVVPRAFDLLPLELCHKIFAQTCNDGGAMGRSLSQVSRGVRLASRRYKYQNLVVRNLYQAEGLAASLEHILASDAARHNAWGQEEYPRVTRLYIEIDVQAMHEDAVAHGDFSPVVMWGAHRLPVPHSPTHTRARAKPWDKEKAHQIKWASALGTLVRDGKALKEPIEALMSSAICRILRAVAPTLESLKLGVLAPKNAISFHGVPDLPALRELELVYSRDSSHRMPTRLLESFPPMEGLKMLNLPRYDARCMPHDLLRQIAKVAPGVVEVRLPSAGVRDGWIGYLEPPREENEGEEEEVAPPSPGASLYSYPPSPLPNGVTKIVIPPLVPPASALDQQFAMSAAEYEMLAKRDGRIQVVDSEAEKAISGEMLEREWLKNVKDGNWWREELR
ncbi:hypothetical protein HWV62_5117 [Athelia sp. TMB]|nr:hypothetical protein HWV62_5117 [Athelia sp. TMB]